MSNKNFDFPAILHVIQRRLDLMLLAKKLWGVPLKRKIQSIQKSDLFSAREKATLIRILRDVGMDSFDAVFDYIHDRRLKLSLMIMQFLRRALHDVPVTAPHISTLRIADRRSHCYYEESRS